MPWKRPEKRRVRAIRDRLREMYGRPLNEPHRRNPLSPDIIEGLFTTLTTLAKDASIPRGWAETAWSCGAQLPGPAVTGRVAIAGRRRVAVAGRRGR